MQGYRTNIEINPRFRDTDAMGHINNAVYLSYLEMARLEYLDKVFGITRFQDIPLILARVEIDYRSPGLLHEKFDLGVRVSSLGGANFTMEYLMDERKSCRCVVEAKTVQVYYDYAEGKVRRLPPDWVRKIKEYDGIS
ncbi:MAG: acyl-CoA thioesterase [Elusimicrobia bacterium]|nr:acyl-CoA thioesterase [Elusimicrobiota bacterium]